MKTNFDTFINEYVNKNFEKEKGDYKIKIENDIKEGITFKRSYKIIEDDIQQNINQLESDTTFKYLKEQFQYIEIGYAPDNPSKYEKTANSEKFNTELISKSMTLDGFIEIHKSYLVQDELRKFHEQNIAIFERYFKIKYNERLKNKVNYDDLVLCKGNHVNDGFTMDEWNRLEDIINPPKKRKLSHKLQKYGKDLTTRDIAIFMNLFKAYYKININSYMEFVSLTRLLFDDLHYNMEAGDPTRGKSIEKYLNGKELFNSKFNFEESKAKVLGILSNINLKDFKKYVENVEEDNFKSLLS